MTELHHRLLFIALLLLSFQSLAANTPDDDIQIDVRKNDGVVVVDASMSVKAPPQNAWEVLTDYDHMAQFFPNLVSSKIVDRSGDKVRVEQKGNVSYGPLSFPFESVRDIELTPGKEIRSHAVSGTLKAGDATTRLVADGAGTRIVYHSESVPGVWVPPAIGPQVIAGQTRAQFESLRNEILKRKSADRRS